MQVPPKSYRVRNRRHRQDPRPSVLVTEAGTPCEAAPVTSAPRSSEEGRSGAGNGCRAPSPGGPRTRSTSRPGVTGIMARPLGGFAEP